MDDDDQELCGFSYDHRTRIIDERDGWRTLECQECGAELFEEVLDDRGLSLRCNHVVDAGATPVIRCGRPEFDDLHDPLGPGGAHVYGNVPVLAEDGLPVYDAA